MKDNLIHFFKTVPEVGPVAARVTRRYTVLSIHTHGQMAPKLQTIMNHRTLVNNLIIPNGCPPVLQMVLNLMKEVVTNSFRLIVDDLTTFLDGGNLEIGGNDANIGGDGEFDMPVGFD